MIVAPLTPKVLGIMAIRNINDQKETNLALWASDKHQLQHSKLVLILQTYLVLQHKIIWFSNNNRIMGVNEITHLCSFNFRALINKTRRYLG
jgi:hypothetical protein